MSRIETFSDTLEVSLTRLATAVDSLERAAERRMRQDEARANAEEEFGLMQDDRSRLAVELELRARSFTHARSRQCPCGRAAGAGGQGN